MHDEVDLVAPDGQAHDDVEPIFARDDGYFVGGHVDPQVFDRVVELLEGGRVVVACRGVVVSRCRIVVASRIAAVEGSLEARDPNACGHEVSDRLAEGLESVSADVKDEGWIDDCGIRRDVLGVGGRRQEEQQRPYPEDLACCRVRAHTPKRSRWTPGTQGHQNCRNGVLRASPDSDRFRSFRLPLSLRSHEVHGDGQSVPAT